MGLAGATAGALSGVVVQAWGYATLALLAALATGPLIALLLGGRCERGSCRRSSGRLSKDVLVLRVAHDRASACRPASPTTNSNPMTPGAMVMNDIVPSGFLRDATSLLHSPKSNTVVALSWRHRDVAQRGVRVARRQLAASRRVGRHGQQLALGRELLEERSSPAPRPRRPPRADRRTAPPGACAGTASRMIQPGSPLVRTTAPTPLLRAATSCRCESRSCRRRGAPPARRTSCRP